MSPWLLTWLANYKRASHSGARQVLLKFLSQNGFEVRRRYSYRWLCRWAAKFSHRYFFRAWRTFRKIWRRLICCFTNEKKKSCVLCRNFVLKVSLTILSAHDDKIRIPARPCNIFYIYIFFHQWLQSFFYLVWSICQLYRYSSCLLFMYVFIYQFTYLLFTYKLSTYRFTYYQNVL